MQGNSSAGSVVRPALLVVSPFDKDHAYLRALFKGSEAEIYGLFDVEDALGYLGRQPLAVVLCEHEFECRDSWKLLLSGLESLKQPPELIVASRLAHAGLWAEVLNLGGFDLLMKPFDEDEVFRVVNHAFRGWLGKSDKLDLGERCGAVAIQTGPDDPRPASSNLGPNVLSNGQGAEK